MYELPNKKLLIVSGSGADVALVKAAKEMGLYVICCDGHTDWTKSPAKSKAHEAWDINYFHTEEVAQKCRENGVDGIIAGYGENKVTAACRIAEALGKPFYATEEQIDITRNKRIFKELCVKNGVPVPKEFCVRLPLSDEDRANIEYPVIVKPSDSGGRQGISVCRSARELDEAMEYALKNSLNGEIVIEEYVTGLEMSSIYTIANGCISLSCVNDKYTYEGEGSVATLCNFVITPSRYFDAYMETVDEGIKSLLKDLHIENGVANFQLIAGENGIRVFEMGYRLNGNNDFTAIREENAGLDYMKMLIHHSLTGDMGDDLSRDDPRFKKFYCTLVRHLHGGTVSKIDCDGLYSLPGVMDVTVLKQVGSVIVDVGNNLQKALMVKFSATSIDEVGEMLDKIQENTDFLDENGKSMLMQSFNVKRLCGYGSGGSCE